MPGGGAGHRVAVLDDYQAVALTVADWSPLGEQVAVTRFSDRVTDAGEIVQRLTGFDVVVAMRERTPFPRSLLEQLPHLRLLVTTGMRNNAIDMEAAAELGIVVSGISLVPTSTVELTWALILAVIRDISGEDRMEVLTWSRNLTPEKAAAHHAASVGFDELLERSDILDLHVPLNAGTRGLIATAELGALGSTGYLINTSRGPIVDQDALVDALHAGTIAGAGPDVYDVEPLPADHPLLSTPRTVLSPHLGFVSQRSLRTAYTGAVEDVGGWLGGAPLRVLNQQES